jgi:hypothetical protein
MLKYVVGDATKPEGQGVKIIPHVTNDIGAWGSGFVVALSNRWPEPESKYRAAGTQKLGTVQTVKVEPGIYVANMCAQHDIRGKFKNGGPRQPIRYGALFRCMLHVGQFTVGQEASIHAPRFGSDRAGGDWKVIEALILETWIDTYGLDVTVYDLE